VKNLLLSVTLVAISLITAYAQVSVEVNLPQNNFLPGESLVAAVRITNRSGQKLKLGADQDWLRFDVESRDGGSVVAKMSDPVVLGEFELDSMKVATKRVDLAPHFNLNQLGRYAIIATVRIKAWDRELASSPKLFDIIHGAKLWEQDFGLPTSDSAVGSPEVRKYILEQANYLKGQLRMYMRLTDSTGDHTLRVFPIGQMVSFSRPEAQIDKLNNLHVLYANGPHTFSYTVFNPDGALTARDIYDYTASRPRLRVSNEGQVSVNGGARRVTASLEKTSAPQETPAKLETPPQPETSAEPKKTAPLEKPNKKP
jgi:hypothetical protein